MKNSTRRDRKVAMLRARELFVAYLKARTLAAYNQVFGTQLAHIPRKPKRTKGRPLP